MSLIFFDLAGVLFTNGSRRLSEGLSRGDPERRARLAEALGGADAWALRRGEIDDDTFWIRMGDRISAIAGRPALDVRREWLRQFVPHPGVARLLGRLSHDGHTLGAIAELTPERAAYFDRAFPFMARLVRRYYSFERHADKRDGRLFELAAADLSSADGPALMFEDEPTAVAQAERVGFCAHLWTTPAAAEALIGQETQDPWHVPAP